ncbi:phosphotransferase [Maritalea mobilis]|uniref:aminoglycoside phosphotransferase family protein n=1 Tax=Maritalea mobilis TaxID=483324 RepID=UPI001C9600A6|nr:phosphotransferase [Maritalea mobilis]MBY6201854.1 phosphotransferase [Maritalea mobilis]
MSISRDEFLDRCGWAHARLDPVAGDASTRHYLRLTDPEGARAILMCAPVDSTADRAAFDAFRRIGGYLRHLDLSAPEEYAAASAEGFLLMEDLGDLSLSHLLETGAPEAETAYRQAAHLLPILAKSAPAGLRAPDAEAMAAMVDLTFDMLGADGVELPALRGRLRVGLTDALARHAGGAPVFALRDMHGDNLIWMPDREGSARVGLLDYQDALRLPLGYDLASLLDDVRRDVPHAWRKDLVEDLSAQIDETYEAATARIDCLSLQRNLRILGVFRRLSRQFGKPAYADYLPRTRRLIARAVENPALARLHQPVSELLDRTAHWSAA